MKVRLPKNPTDSTTTTERPSTIPDAIIVNPVPPAYIEHEAGEERCPCCGGKLVPAEEFLDPFELAPMLDSVSKEDRDGDFGSELHAQMLASFVEVAAKEAILRSIKKTEFDEIATLTEESTEKLERLTESAAKLRASLSELTTRASELANQRSALGIQIERGDEKVWRLEQKLSRLHSDLSQAEHALDEADSNRSRQTAQTKCDRISGDSFKSETDLAQTKQKLAKRKQELANSEEEEKLLKVKVETVTAELKAEETKCAEMAKYVEKLALPYFFIESVDGTVVMTTLNYETDTDGGELYSMKQFNLSGKWARRVFDYAFREFGVSLSVAEYYTLIKIVMSVVKLNPGQYNIRYGEGTEIVQQIVQHFASKNF